MSLNIKSVLYFRLPEIPPDTPETNEVMRVADLPDFQSITPDKIITGCAKLAIEYETYLGKHLEDLKGIIFLD